MASRTGRVKHASALGLPKRASVAQVPEHEAGDVVDERLRFLVGEILRSVCRSTTAATIASLFGKY